MKFYCAILFGIDLIAATRAEGGLVFAMAWWIHPFKKLAQVQKRRVTTVQPLTLMTEALSTAFPLKN